MIQPSFRLLFLALTVAMPSHAAEVAANPPPKTARARLTDAPTRQESRVYQVTPEGELRLHFYLPKEGKASDQRPAIIFFHGAGGGAEEFFPQAEYFASRGLVCASADYPVSRTRDASLKLTEPLGHAKAAMRWLRSHASEFGVDPNKLIAAGGSLGGMLALATALIPGFDSSADDRAIRCEPDALVLFNPAIRVRANSVDAAGKPLGDNISPVLFLKNGAPPTSIFFGTADPLNKLAPEFIAKSRALGNRCDYFIAADQPHGFFSRQPWASATAIQADKFLASLGYLQGPPTLQPADATTVLVQVK